MLEPLERFFRRVGCLILLDRATDPAANGHVQRNGTHIKVYSGGAVRNLSDVGTAPSHTHASHTGIGTGDHHAQLHAAAHQPGGGDAMAVDAAAATGSLRTLGTTALKAAAGDHTHAAVGAVTRSGGNTTEATTTSTTAVDLLTASTLSVAATKPVWWVASLRKSTGAADTAYVGLKVNTTITRAPDSWATVTNQVEQGWVEGFYSPRVTDYLGGAYIRQGNKEGNAINNYQGANSALIPNATITDVTVNARVGNAATTMGADELHVYDYSTS